MLDLIETAALWAIIGILTIAAAGMMLAFFVWVGLAVVHIGRAFARGVR